MWSAGLRGSFKSEAVEAAVEAVRMLKVEVAGAEVMEWVVVVELTEEVREVEELDEPDELWEVDELWELELDKLEDFTVENVAAGETVEVEMTVTVDTAALAQALVAENGQWGGPWPGKPPWKGKPWAGEPCCQAWAPAASAPRARKECMVWETNSRREVFFAYRCIHEYTPLQHDRHGLMYDKLHLRSRSRGQGKDRRREHKLVARRIVAHPSCTMRLKTSNRSSL
jgi:hypothetical protein